MHQLSSTAVRLLTSSQVISSIVSVVKELIENSLDAGATSIEVRLDNDGLDKIEVTDNGHGVGAEDVPFMARPHFTSKISDTADLDDLLTYGFRGEALGSLCCVSSVLITTRTANELSATTYTMDHNGYVVLSKPSPMPPGTTVTALNLFKNVPVRRQYYSNKRKGKEESKKIENLVQQFAVIQPGVRFVLKSGSSIVWQKAPVTDHQQALLKILGRNALSTLNHVQESNSELQAEIEAFLPPIEVACQFPSVGFYFVNRRPVTFKKLEKVIKQLYSTSSESKLQFVFLHLKVPPNQLDVNLEPNKTNVLVHNEVEVLAWIAGIIEKQVCNEANKKDSNNGAMVSPTVDAPISESVSSSLCGDSSVKKITADKQQEVLVSNFNLQTASDDIDGKIKHVDENESSNTTSSTGPPELSIYSKVSCDAEKWSHGHAVEGATLDSEQPVKLLSPGPPITSSTQHIKTKDGPKTPINETNRTLSISVLAGKSVEAKTSKLLRSSDIVCKSPCTHPVTPFVKKRKIEHLSKNSVLDILNSAKKAKKENRAAPKKSKLIEAKLFKIRHAWKNDHYLSFSKEWEKVTESNSIGLVGCLESHGAWVVRHGRKLHLFQPLRAKEELIYQKMIKTNILPSSALENPIVIHPSAIGEQLWNALFTLEQSSVSPADLFPFFCDPRLTANGFIIHGSKSALNTVEITAMATCVKHLGLNDLKFILEQICLHSHCSIEDSRPSKVQHYFQSEATRIARLLPWKQDPEDVRDTWSEVHKSLEAEHTSCFHARPFSVLLGEMDK